MIGVPVKDYNSQTTMFTLCIIGLAEGALQFWHKGKRLCAVLCVLLVTSFFVNILYATTSRTALVALPLLFALFAFRRLSWSSAGALLIAMIMSFAAVWPTSPRLGARVADFLEEVRTYEPTGVPTSAGERLEFWRKSIDIVAAAPFFGHGTGSIRQQFRQSTAGQTGMAGLVTADPHNQIFATAIQLGLAGTVVLLAMWIAHLFFFSTCESSSGDRPERCRAEYDQPTVQLFSVRFDSRLALCSGGRGHRWNDTAPARNARPPHKEGAPAGCF
jgi:O-antigen ligase